MSSPGEKGMKQTSPLPMGKPQEPDMRAVGRGVAQCYGRADLCLMRRLKLHRGGDVWPGLVMLPVSAKQEDSRA